MTPPSADHPINVLGYVWAKKLYNRDPSS